MEVSNSASPIMRHAPGVDHVVVVPGRYFMGGAACRMETSLASGIAVALWNRTPQTGVLVNFERVNHDGGHALRLDGRDAAEGLQRVLQALRWAQVDPGNCVARICGSGEIKTRMDRVPSLNSGQTSGETVRALLRACRLPIISESFYTGAHQRIIFDVATGRVRVVVARDAVAAIASKPRAAARGQRSIVIAG